MPEILTDAATFDTSLAVPVDGDARNAASVKPAFQKLLNRDGALKARLDAKDMYAIYSLSTTPVVGVGLFGLSFVKGNAGFSLVSSRIHVPAFGEYLFMVNARVATSVVTNPSVVSLAFTMSSGDEGFDLSSERRWSATAGQDVLLGGQYIFSCNNSNDDVGLANLTGATITASAGGIITVLRVS